MKEKKKPEIEEDRFFASFDDTDGAVMELLERMGLLKLIEAIEDSEVRARVLDEVITYFRPVLEDANKLDINKPQGKPQFMVGKRHFNLHKLIFSTLELGAAALVIVVLPPVAPLTAAVAGVAVAPAAISILGKLKEIVHSLTPEELAVYNAIAGVIVEKQNKALAEKKAANAEEIKEYFLAKKQAPPKLDALLKSMEAKHVIEPFAGGDGQTTFYKLVP